jgi:hypothetical protein
VLGKENNNDEDNDNRDSRDDDIIEKDSDGEGFEDISIMNCLIMMIIEIVEMMI